ncbi:hypothetical protein [Halegenticoccus tardaugens]|uniref:hypothetical protein n=1 Tax=Halegenticoccus tardaugens TaxID=2071624 RepID=UPI00100A264C|nr:hypothetical protein [Halegenticoccus tardaugens]
MADAGRGPIDSAVLESFRDRVRGHSLVARTGGARTDGRLTALVLHLDADRYPATVLEASVEIQWYVNDEYNFHYRERHDEGTVWQCRWDRHPNPHAADAHFHGPPDADATNVVDDPVTVTHPADVLTRTMANVDDRIADLWERVAIGEGTGRRREPPPNSER